MTNDLKQYAEARQMSQDDALAYALRVAEFHAKTKPYVNKRLSYLLARLEALHGVVLPWFSPCYDSLDLLLLEPTAISVAQVLRVFYSLFPELASVKLMVDDNEIDLSLGQSEYSRLAIALLADEQFSRQLEQ